MSNTGRWILGSGIPATYAWAQCSYCGRAQSHDCTPVACLLCGTVQCFGNGSKCSVCHYGRIPGWSCSSDERFCGRKGCGAPAVSSAPRVRQVCAEHAKTTKLRLGQRSVTIADYAIERVAHRDSGKGWEHWRFAA